MANVSHHNIFLSHSVVAALGQQVLKGLLIIIKFLLEGVKILRRHSNQWLLNRILVSQDVLVPAPEPGIHGQADFYSIGLDTCHIDRSHSTEGVAGHY